MRFVTHGVTAVLALIIGLGIGYLMWGLQGVELARLMDQQRLELNYKIAEAERRTKTAEEVARQEKETRKIFEEELNRARPQK